MSIWNRLFQPPKPDGFSRLVTKVLRASGTKAHIDYDPGHFKLTIHEEPTPRVLFLGNMYHDYCKAPVRERRGVITRYIRCFSTVGSKVPDGLDDLRSHLFPHVRDRAFHGITRLQSEAQGFELQPIPTKLLTEQLSIELVYDSPDHLMTVSSDHLEMWGITLDEGLAIGRDNLWKVSNQEFLKIQPGLFASPWHDAHDASRLILHDLIWQLPVKGEHVAMVPHRDLLLVTGTDDEVGLAKMAEIAAIEMNGNRVVSAIPVRLQGTTWQPFLPSSDHPAGSSLRRLRLEMMARDYEQQKQMLEELHEKQDKAVFVASCMLMQEPGGKELLFSVWSEGIETLLPHTEHIALHAEWLPKGAACRIPTWADVEAVAGELMAPAGLYPERYLVKGFPSREQLVKLGVLEQ